MLHQCHLLVSIPKCFVDLLLCVHTVMLLSSGESLSPDEIEAVRVRNAASMSSCRFPAFDQLLNFIAQDVRASIDGAPVEKKYFIANNLHSNRPGFHWVAVVYDIKASSEYPLFVTPHLKRTQDINTRIDFGADADFSSSSYLPPLPLVVASSSSAPYVYDSLSAFLSD